MTHHRARRTQLPTPAGRRWWRAPLVIGIASIIPGLGFGLRQQWRRALGVAGLIAALGLLFGIWPSWPTWSALCLAWLAQMAAAAIPPWLAERRLTGFPSPHPNDALLSRPAPFPEGVSPGTDPAQTVRAHLQVHLAATDRLAAAVVGLQPEATVHDYLGLTTADLILVRSTPHEGLKLAERYSREDVKWVSLIIGPRSLLLEIDLAGQATRRWRVPRQLLAACHAFTEAFPSGTEHAPAFPLLPRLTNWRFRTRTLKFFAPALGLVFLTAFLNQAGVFAAWPGSSERFLGWWVYGATFTLCGWPFILEALDTWVARPHTILAGIETLAHAVLGVGLWTFAVIQAGQWVLALP